jgi:O-antigen/teichoic acid export membrane protein
MTFRGALAWSVSGQVVSYLIVFIGSVVVARLLSPHEMGVFALAIATIGILNTIVAFNVSTYVVRATELAAATLDSAFTVNGILACVIATAIFSSSLAARFLFHAPDVANVMAPLAAIPLVGILEFRPNAMLQREMNFRSLSLIGAFTGIMGTTTVIALAMRGYSYMSLPYGNLVSAFLSLILTNIAGRRHVRIGFSLSEARQISVFGLRMMSIGGVAALAARLSDLVLGTFQGLAALGLYSRASNISNLIFQNVYGAATRVVFVQLSKDYRERGVLRDVFLRSFEMITAVMWPLQLGLAVLSPPAIYILYGAKWVDAAAPLSLLMIAQSVVLCFGMNWELFVLRDETAKQTRYEFVRAIAGVITFSIGSLFSLSAAAVGRIAEAVFGLALYYPHMNRMADTKPGELARIFANGFGLTLAAIAPSICLMFLTHWSYRTPPMLIAGAVAAGIGLWLALLSIQKHPLLDEIRHVGRRLSGLVSQD